MSYGKKSIHFKIDEKCKVELLYELGDVVPKSDDPTPLAKVEIDGEEKIFYMPISRLDSKVTYSVELDDECIVDPQEDEAVLILTVELDGIRTIGSKETPLDRGNIPEQFRTRVGDKTLTNDFVELLIKKKDGNVSEEQFINATKLESLQTLEPVNEEGGDAAEEVEGEADDEVGGDAGGVEGGTDDEGDGDSDDEEILDIRALLELENDDEETVELTTTVVTGPMNKIDLERTAISYHRRGDISEPDTDKLVQRIIEDAIEENSSKRIDTSPSLESLEIDDETNEWLESNNVQDMRSLRTKMIDTESDFTQNLIDVYVALVREDYVERMELGTTVESKDQVDDILGDKEKLLHFYESVESDIPGEEIEELAQEFENLGGRNKTRLKTLRRKIIECIVDLKPMLSEGIEGEEEVSRKQDDAHNLYQGFMEFLEKIDSLLNSADNVESG